MSITNNNGEISFGGLVEVVHSLKDATSLSLTQYTKDCIVSSRVFIDNTLHDESDGILPSLFHSLMNTYVALIMTGMNMNQYITSTKKVRDAMSIVATEHMGVVEANHTEYSPDLVSNFFGSVMPNTMNMQEAYDALRNEEVGDVVSNTGKDGVIDTDSRTGSAPIQSRVISVSFGSNSALDTQGKQGAAVSVNLLVQLAPYYVTSGVAKQFLAANFKPAFTQRLMQWQAGELTARDLFLSLDIHRKRLKALKADKSGMLQEMEERRQNSLANAWLKYATVTPNRQNIANTILIYDKNTFDSACSDTGMRVNDYNQRQKFFNRTFSMMLVILNPDYNKCTIYYNGINQVTECTFDQLKKEAKNEKFDITTYMKQYAQGFAPKY